MKHALLFALPFVVAGCDGDIFGLDSCTVDRDIHDELNADVASVVRILADDGHIEVRGRSGLTRVRVSGRACAEDRSLLDDIDLVLDRSGDAIRLVTFVPDDWHDDDARLDLIVEVPSDMIVDIEHARGDLKVRDVHAAFIFDDDGAIDVEDVALDVEISDGSGNIRLRGIGGDVYLVDESGNIDVRGVDGRVLVDEDTSGDIYIEDVRDDVLIGEDGSGDIEVVDIGGDFVVGLDTSGRIRYRNVRGMVDIP